MKLNSLAFLVLMAFGAAAHAQLANSKPQGAAPAGRSVATVPAAQQAPNSPAPAPASTATMAAPSAPAADMNPFTGKNLSVEQIQQKLEESRLQTLALEEMLKQLNITQELSNVPLRKAVEAAQARTSVKKEELAQKDLEKQMKAPATASASAVAGGLGSTKAGSASKSSSKKKPVAKPAVEAAPAPAPAVAPAAPPRPPKPSLLSVVSVGGSSSVVLDFDGNTLVVGDGEMTPAGPVKVVDAGTVLLNGDKLKVRGNTLSRFVVSDREDKKSATGGMNPPVGLSSPQAAGAASSSAAALGQGAPAATLPLPPLPGANGAPPTYGGLPGPKLAPPPALPVSPPR